jgi:hypothetical protein
MAAAQYMEIHRARFLNFAGPALKIRTVFICPANPGLRTGGNLLDFLHIAGPCRAQARFKL